MKLKLIREAALLLGYEEPISIEPNGDIWLGNETDRQDLSTADVKKVQAKADILQADKATAKAALLDKLGITADEAALLLG